MMDGVHIRKLGPDDLGLLLAAPEGTFDFPLIEAQARAFLASESHLIVVALVRGAVVGMATGVVLLHPDKAPVLHVNEVGVHEDFQRRGIGRRLMKSLMNLARRRGITGVWLATEQDNVAARALYRSLGARETGGIVVCDWGGVMDED